MAIILLVSLLVEGAINLLEKVESRSDFFRE